MSLDYFESNLLRTVKSRVFSELTDTLQQHSYYRDIVKAYHKFPYTERPMFGVVLKNASGTRLPLSSDDFAATVASHVALARAQNYEGRLLKWVWEDELSITRPVINEDLSSQLSGSPTFGTNRVFTVQHPPIMAGQYNTEVASNFRQVSVTINGSPAFSEFVDGSKGVIIMPEAPPSDATIVVSYWYKSLVAPGRYYLELIDSNNFVIDPIYVVKDEEVISRTTGTETTASLPNGDLLSGFDVLYTKKTKKSIKINLERDVDYTLSLSGLITFLNPLPADTTLYANYRWIGDRLGPFSMPDGEFQYNNTALTGVVLAFGSERTVGDKNVIIVYPKRETAAKVYSGHWSMTFSIDVMARDPVQLPELTDYIVEDMWSRKRVPLIMEGLTMETCEPTGEFEEVYDENTGDQYYKNSINLVLMTEWKKFVPYLTEIMDYTYTMHQIPQERYSYKISNDGRIFETQLIPYSEPFEVIYPESGMVRYY